MPPTVNSFGNTGIGSVLKHEATAFFCGVLFALLLVYIGRVFWLIGSLEARVDFQQAAIKSSQKTLDETKRDLAELRARPK